jgi:hypothetical protein
MRAVTEIRCGFTSRTIGEKWEDQARARGASTRRALMPIRRDEPAPHTVRAAARTDSLAN